MNDELDAAKEDGRRWQEALGKYTRENKRLRDELAGYRDRYDNSLQENEKLREELGSDDELAEWYFERLDQEHAELTRLRKERDRFQQLYAQAQTEVESLRFAAENAHQDIERLRERGME